MEIINLMKLLTNEQQISYQTAKMWYICKENFKYKYSQDEKVTNHCHCTREYRGAAHGVCNFKYSIPKNFPIVFHNGSDYDYHFIMKELAEEFEKQLTYLGENTESITFTVLIENEVTRIYENGEEITKALSYILQFIDCARFIASSLSSLVNNLSGGIHENKIKFKYYQNDRNFQN